MATASGINKIVSYKKETTFGTLPSASGAQTIDELVLLST